MAEQNSESQQNVQQPQVIEMPPALINIPKPQIQDPADTYSPRPYTSPFSETNPQQPDNNSRPPEIIIPDKKSENNDKGKITPEARAKLISPGNEQNLKPASNAANTISPQDRTITEKPHQEIPGPDIRFETRRRSPVDGPFDDHTNGGRLPSYVYPSKPEPVAPKPKRKAKKAKKVTKQEIIEPHIPLVTPATQTEPKKEKPVGPGRGFREGEQGYLTKEGIFTEEQLEEIEKRKTAEVTKELLSGHPSVAELLAKLLIQKGGGTEEQQQAVVQQIQSLPGAPGKGTKPSRAAMKKKPVKKTPAAKKAKAKKPAKTVSDFEIFIQMNPNTGFENHHIIPQYIFHRAENPRIREIYYELRAQSVLKETHHVIHDKIINDELRGRGLMPSSKNDSLSNKEVEEAIATLAQVYRREGLNEYADHTEGFLNAMRNAGLLN